MGRWMEVLVRSLVFDCMCERGVLDMGIYIV